MMTEIYSSIPKSSWASWNITRRLWIWRTLILWRPTCCLGTSVHLLGFKTSTSSVNLSCKRVFLCLFSICWVFFSRSLCVDALIELSDENADWKLSLTEFINCLTPTYHPPERSNHTHTYLLLPKPRLTIIVKDKRHAESTNRTSFSAHIRLYFQNKRFCRFSSL